MISFSCSHCGIKLKVKPQFAGRSCPCPACKQPLVVPTINQADAPVPVGQIDGTPSSLAKAGMKSDVSLGQAVSASRSDHKPVQELLTRRNQKDGRYLIEKEIARGGMGAVLRAVDCDIRREVAIKYLLNQTDTMKKARFIEEAQITGQLEHPSIVPIHELGVDAKKRLYFTMKMIKGRSLAQVLNELRQQPKKAEKDYSLNRLLNLFVQICNALAYAHSQNVIHRDLKPANIMMGDFGEVYVMDWGIAKVLRGDEPPVNEPTPSPIKNMSSTAGKQAVTGEANADLTQQGAILGTPVYMPPEQAAG